MQTCPNCGSEICEEAKFCEDCGAKLFQQGGAVKRDQQPSEQRSTSQCGETPHQQPSKQQQQTSPKRKMGNKKLVLVVIGILIIATLGGFFQVRKRAFEQTEISITDVRNPRVGLTSATIPLVLAIENPSSYSTPNLMLHLEVIINEETVGKERISIDSISSESQVLERIELIVSYYDVGTGIWDAIVNLNFSLKIEGTSEGDIFGFIPVSEDFQSSYSL